MTLHLDARLLLLAVALLCLPGARRQKLIDPIPWEQPEIYEAEDFGALVPDRVLVVAGDPAPFDGWLLAGASFPRLAAACGETAGALDDCNANRRRDRYLADEIHASTVDGLKTCRASKPRDFAAGCGVCFGGAAVIGWAVEGAR